MRAVDFFSTGLCTLAGGVLIAGGLAVTLIGAANFGRARTRMPGLTRWVVAVLEGYRVVVAYAKLWERRRDRTLEIG